MQAKIVRFTTPTGVVRQGRVTEEYLLHGRLRYTVETEFGDIFVWADQTDNITPPQAAKPPSRAP